jgi:hypothetical protein
MMMTMMKMVMMFMITLMRITMKCILQSILGNLSWYVKSLGHIVFGYNILDINFDKIKGIITCLTVICPIMVLPQMVHMMMLALMFTCVNLVPGMLQRY